MIFFRYKETINKSAKNSKKQTCLFHVQINGKICSVNSSSKVPFWQLKTEGEVSVILQPKEQCATQASLWTYATGTTCNWFHSWHMNMIKHIQYQSIHSNTVLWLKYAISNKVGYISIYDSMCSWNGVTYHTHTPKSPNKTTCVARTGPGCKQHRGQDYICFLMFYRFFFFFFFLSSSQ